MIPRNDRPDFVARSVRPRCILNPASGRNDELIRGQLVRWDQGSLVQQLETRCARVRYYTCSSLGRMPDATARAFAGRGVLEPLLWILGVADGRFFQAARPASTNP